MKNNHIQVEVAFATPNEQRIIEVDVEAGTTIATVIDRSGISAIFPEIDLNNQKVGIFGQLRQLSDIVEAGDRVEIYRSLTIDPMEARRNKAELVKKKKLIEARKKI